MSFESNEDRIEKLEKKVIDLEALIVTFSKLFKILGDRSEVNLAADILTFQEINRLDSGIIALAGLLAPLLEITPDQLAGLTENCGDASNRVKKHREVLERLQALAKAGPLLPPLPPAT